MDALASLTAQRDAAKNTDAADKSDAPAYVLYNDDKPAISRRVGSDVAITKRAADESDVPVAFVQTGERRRVDIAGAVIGVGSVDPSLLSAKGKAYRKALIG